MSSPANVVSLSPAERKYIAKVIKERIDAYCVATFDEGPRSHLGGSIIGDDCSRKLWYGFRWVKHERFSGRMLRLFNRGHKEEDRFLQWLRGIGFVVHDLSPQGSQWRIHAVKNHFGGSLDGRSEVPQFLIDLLPKLAGLNGFLCEFKTYGSKQFEKLEKAGSVIVAKPMHYRQMNTYGAAYQYRYALYVAVNKDTDELWVEIVELDARNGGLMARKAEDIITSQEPPPRQSNNPEYGGCKFCHLHAVCFEGADYDVNCRSCRFARPVDNAEWHCDAYNAVIPKEYIAKACPHWQGIGL